MKQGNIGLFINAVGDKRYLWKVRDPNATRSLPEYYDMMTGETVEPMNVTDCTSDGVQKQWVIRHELTPAQALAMIKFSPDANIDTVCERMTARELFKRDTELRMELKTIDLQLHACEKEFQKLGENRARVVEEIGKITDEYGQLPPDARYLYLVHAYHSATDTVDYMWYASPEIAKKVAPGDLISVQTSRGAQPAIVRYVEKTQTYVPHKDVIEIIRKGNG